MAIGARTRGDSAIDRTEPDKPPANPSSSSHEEPRRSPLARPRSGGDRPGPAGNGAHHTPRLRLQDIVRVTERGDLGGRGVGAGINAVVINKTCAAAPRLP